MHETRFDTSNIELARKLCKGKNKKTNGLIEAKLGGKVMTNFTALRPKTDTCLRDGIDENKKRKRQKKVKSEKLNLKIILKIIFSLKKKIK